MPDPALRSRDVVLVLAAALTGTLYAKYVHATSPLPRLVGFLLAAGFVLGVGWVVWRWTTVLRTYDPARIGTATVALAGLLVALASLYAPAPPVCPACLTPDVAYWRHADVAVTSHPDRWLGVAVPTLVFDAEVHCFCPTYVALPHLVGGLALVGAGALADRRRRGDANSSVG